MLSLILIVTLLGSLAGILGGLFLLWQEQIARKLSLYFVAFATGSLLAAAFLDLMPEALEAAEMQAVMIAVLVGFLTFLLLEKFLIWYHCHDGQCDVHDQATYRYTIIIGDTLHNFVDGIAIAISFLIDVRLGFATAVAVFAHEIPQEIGDFGVLLHAGLSRFKVFTYNLVSAVAAPVGALIGFYLSGTLGSIEPLILAFIAGSFVYVAAADLIPHLAHEHKWRPSIIQLILMVLGIVVIALVG
jgi:zinc and cadmium transporter